MKPQPLLHLIEPHERAMVEEDEVEPYKYRGLIWISLFVFCVAIWSVAIWRLL